MKCPNEDAEMLMFKKPISVFGLFDPNLLEDCDWEGWDEDKLGWIAGVCPECNFITGISPPEKPMCPECGGTEVDPQPGYARASSGEVEYIDYDPICKGCGRPFGDDWVQSSNQKVKKCI